MLVGTADDTVRQPTLVAAKAKMGQLRLAGFDAVRVAQTWAPGQVVPSAEDLAVLQNVAGHRWAELSNKAASTLTTA